MSRCFPFPPPGYMRNGTCSEALIESIKLQKERDEAKEDRKKDKRKTKEKRKDRKERKEKEGKATHAREGKGSKLNNVESYHLEKIRAEPGSCCLQKVDEDESEQLERSGITEELDQPFSSHEPCCLSDSTQSSNKRKRSNSSSSNDHGTIFKIRLPLRKHRESEVSRLEYQAGSTSGSIGTADSFTNETCRPSQSLRDSGSKHSKEYQVLIQDSAGVDYLKTNLIDHESQRMASIYDSLFLNLTSDTPQCDGINSEDQDWLFPSELREGRPEPKKVKSVNDTLRCSNPTLWPRAQYLPEADIYGLPYAIPF